MARARGTLYVHAETGTVRYEAGDQILEEHLGLIANPDALEDEGDQPEATEPVSYPHEGPEGLTVLGPDVFATVANTEAGERRAIVWLGQWFFPLADEAEAVAEAPAEVPEVETPGEPAEAPAADAEVEAPEAETPVEARVPRSRSRK